MVVPDGYMIIWFNVNYGKLLCRCNIRNILKIQRNFLLILLGKILISNKLLFLISVALIVWVLVNLGNYSKIYLILCIINFRLIIMLFSYPWKKAKSILSLISVELKNFKFKKLVLEMALYLWIWWWKLLKLMFMIVTNKI